MLCHKVDPICDLFVAVRSLQHGGDLGPDQAGGDNGILSRKQLHDCTALRIGTGSLRAAVIAGTFCRKRPTSSPAPSLSFR